jgi:hypothetical protein
LSSLQGNHHFDFYHHRYEAGYGAETTGTWKIIKILEETNPGIKTE